MLSFSTFGSTRSSSTRTCLQNWPKGPGTVFHWIKKKPNINPNPFLGIIPTVRTSRPSAEWIIISLPSQCLTSRPISVRRISSRWLPVVATAPLTRQVSISIGMKDPHQENCACGGGVDRGRFWCYDFIKECWECFLVFIRFSTQEKYISRLSYNLSFTLVPSSSSFFVHVDVTNFHPLVASYPF